jgi:probable addiction module antidote protein
MRRAVRHQDYLKKHLSNATEAAAYLNAVAEDGDIRFLLKAIRHVVIAQGGIGELSRRTHFSRTTLYKTLSEDGNPEVATLDAILRIYGLRINVVADPSHRLAA